MYGRYWTYDKDYAQRTLESLVKTLGELAGQELTVIVDNELFEFEGANLISLPPAQIVLFEALKNCKKLVKLIEEDALPSLSKKEG